MASEIIFISYAREDSEVALRLYTDLTASGHNPWIDQISIAPGKIWKDEISRAIRSSRYFVLLLSKNSVSKRGFCQKEVKVALDTFDEFAPGDVFIIPARLEECSPLDERLRQIQWVDLFPNYGTGLSKILEVIKKDSSDLELLGARTLKSILEGKNTDDEIKIALQEYVKAKTSRNLNQRAANLLRVAAFNSR